MTLRPETYEAAARRLRRIADNLDARCEPRTPRQKAALTSTVYGLSRYARQLAEKHRRTMKPKALMRKQVIEVDGIKMRRTKTLVVGKRRLRLPSGGTRQ